MKNINWEVRLKNKQFWLALIPAVLLLVQAVAKCIWLYFRFKCMSGDKLLVVVKYIIYCSCNFGSSCRSTSGGIRDSENALTYTEPK